MSEKYSITEEKRGMLNANQKTLRYQKLKARREMPNEQNHVLSVGGCNDSVQHFIPEIAHHLAAIKEAVMGRQICSFEIGPQDTLPKAQMDEVFDTCFFDSIKEQNEPLKYTRHPLFSILETNNLATAHSNWYQRIGWAVDRMTHVPRVGLQLTMVENLKRELDLLTEIRCFIDAARDAVVLLFHADFKQRHRLGFCHVTPTTNTIPHTIWKIYQPMFTEDKVFVKDGIILTVIGGGQPRDLSQVVEEETENLFFIHNPPYQPERQRYRCDTFSIREAEKTYKTMLKANQVLAHTILKFNHSMFISNNSLRSRFALPIAVMIRYCTVCVMAEPMIPIVEPPFDLVNDFRVASNPMYHRAYQKTAEELLEDKAFIDHVDYIKSILGLQTYPFPFLLKRQVVSDFAFFYGQKCILAHPQLLLSFRDKKIIARRCLELLPPLPTCISKHYNPHNFNPKHLIRRMRPELLLTTKTVGDHKAAAHKASWFGKLQQMLYVESALFSKVQNTTLLSTTKETEKHCSSRSSSNMILAFDDALFQHAESPYGRTYKALENKTIAYIDSDLPLKERLRREEAGFGTIEPFSSCQDKMKGTCYDSYITRNTVLDTFGSSASEGATPFSSTPNQLAITDMTNVILRSTLFQLEQLTIIWVDSFDISRTLHNHGLPIRLLPMVLTEPTLSSDIRFVIAADLIARTVKHWFTNAVRPHIVNALFNEPNFNDTNNDMMDKASHDYHTGRDINTPKDTILDVIDELQRDIVRQCELLLDPGQAVHQFYPRIIQPLIEQYWEIAAYTSNLKLEEYMALLDISVIPWKIMFNALQCHLGVLFAQASTLDLKDVNNNFATASFKKEKSTNGFTISLHNLSDFTDASYGTVASDIWEERDPKTQLPAISRFVAEDENESAIPHNTGNAREREILQTETLGERKKNVFKRKSSHNFMAASRWILPNIIANDLFPHLAALKEALVGQPITILPILSSQKTHGVNRLFRGFFPKVWTVSPLNSLSSIEACQTKITEHFLRNARIPSPVTLLRGMDPWSSAAKNISALEKQCLTEPNIIVNWESINMVNPTSIGNLFPLKAALFGESCPCQPACLHLDPEDLHNALKKELDCKKATSTSDEELSFYTGAATFRGTLTQLQQTSPRPICRFFLEFVVSLRCITFAYQTLSCGSNYQAAFVSELNDTGIYRLFLLLGYAYLQHNYVHLAEAMALYTAVNAPKVSSNFIRAQELLLQCSLRSGMRSNTDKFCVIFSLGKEKQAKKIFELICNYTREIISEFGSSAQPFSAILMNCHLCFAAYFLYIKDWQQALSHATEGVRLSVHLFGGERCSWITFIGYDMMGKAALEAGDFRQAETACRQALRGCRTSATITSAVECRALVLMSKIHARVGNLEEAFQIALDVSSRLERIKGPLIAETLSSLYLAAQLAHHLAVRWLECPPLGKASFENENDVIPHDNTVPTTGWVTGADTAKVHVAQKLKRMAYKRDKAYDEGFQRQSEQLRHIDAAAVNEVAEDYYNKAISINDLDSLLEIWHDKTRMQALTHACELYDRLFRRLVARLRYQNGQQLVLYDVQIFQDPLFETSSGRIMQVPVPLCQTKDKESLNKREELQRIFNVISCVLKLRAISLNYDEQRSFMSQLQRLLASQSFLLATATTATFQRKNRTNDIFDNALHEAGERGKDIKKNSEIVVAPAGVVYSSNTQKSLIEHCLYKGGPVEIENICHSVLYDCCELKHFPNINGESVRVLKTPNIWFDDLLCTALGSDISHNESFMTLLEIVRCCCPNSVKQILLFHLTLGLTHPLARPQQTVASRAQNACRKSATSQLRSHQHKATQKVEFQPHLKLDRFEITQEDLMVNHQQEDYRNAATPSLSVTELLNKGDQETSGMMRLQDNQQKQFPFDKNNNKKEPSLVKSRYYKEESEAAQYNNARLTSSLHGAKIKGRVVWRSNVNNV